MMNRVDFDALAARFTQAHEEGRGFLYEYEVYDFLSHLGAETPPKCSLILKGMQPSDEEIMAIPGDRAVLKIVSPTILHKTEVGGVRVVEKEPNKVRSAIRRMLYEVPENFAVWIEHNQQAAPDVYKGLVGEALVAAIRNDLKGVLHVQFMPPDSSAFGNELIVGLRRTREFGTVISAGLGGTDTELYAERFRKGQAIVAASVEMTDGQEFFELFKKTISYRKLAGLTRGQRRIVTDEQLIECFNAFILAARYFSPANPDAPFVIDELEINPFAFTDYLMVPLDGLCKFSLPGAQPVARPVEKIKAITNPKTIGIIGVSSTRMNFGRIIMNSILDAGYDAKKVYAIKPGSDEVDGVRCVPDLKSLPEPLDLFIVAVGAPQVPDLVDEILEANNVNAVMLIPGGMGETEESKDRAVELAEKINGAHASGTGPVFLGGNCMGVISHPGQYDSWFVPESKLPKSSGKTYKRAAFISQSGAFMVTRMAQCPEIEPAYLISMGNQNDLTLGDMANYFKKSDDVDVIAIYAEGFKNLDGLAFCKAIRDAVLAGKDVVFYKAGRTQEGKKATAGHTASLAGDYMVCESCVRQAGAIVARNFAEFENLIMLAQRLNRKVVRGNRLGAISSAGFETVGMADSIHSDDFDMQLATLSEKTTEILNEVIVRKRLDKLVNVHNPLDINPSADDEVHAIAARALCDDPGVDAVALSLLPMAPAMFPALDNLDKLDTEGTIIPLLKKLSQETETPLVCCVNAGSYYDKLIETIGEADIPVFRSADSAVSALSQYIEGRLNAARIRASSEL
ncbi:CoA-binding protein [Pseudodesulfovibrio sp. JC047]|uniref:acetate--CoA ligase family protein n=1 Tax=Pseudodesulfovibrio sp. JC047 TaxID=2683199 RepID=UPI0013D63538|nr:acetate--CoA ligase family protein [Pseudodesulfovibrio sp. JC047]NDV19046.1 CoA-binding protein [Pseudodesulfovibrio sp. JC047]